MPAKTIMLSVTDGITWTANRTKCLYPSKRSLYGNKHQ